MLSWRCKMVYIALPFIFILAFTIHIIKIKKEITDYLIQSNLINCTESIDIIEYKKSNDICVCLYETEEKVGMLFWVDKRLCGGNIAGSNIENMEQCSLFQVNDFARGSKLIIVWGNGHNVDGYYLEYEDGTMICKNNVPDDIFIDIFEYPHTQEEQSWGTVYLNEVKNTQ